MVHIIIPIQSLASFYIFTCSTICKHPTLSLRFAMDPPPDSALARGQLPAGTFDPSKSGEPASCRPSSPKRRRGRPSSGAEVSPSLWFKRVYFSTSVGSRAGGARCQINKFCGGFATGCAVSSTHVLGVGWFLFFKDN